jgi:hypothetical protein
MSGYSYHTTIRDAKGVILDEYRERPAPVAKVPGVRLVRWVEDIGRHVKM